MVQKADEADGEKIFNIKIGYSRERTRSSENSPSESFSDKGAARAQSKVHPSRGAGDGFFNRYGHKMSRP